MGIRMKRLGAGAATLAVASALVVGGATSANAVSRMPCASHTLNLVSSDTTCWGYAGYASVTLYGVYGIISGNNAGYVQGSGGTTYFQKYETWSLSTQTISGIGIYSV